MARAFELRFRDDETDMEDYKDEDKNKKFLFHFLPSY